MENSLDTVELTAEDARTIYEQQQESYRNIKNQIQSLLRISIAVVAIVATFGVNQVRFLSSILPADETIFVPPDFIQIFPEATYVVALLVALVGLFRLLRSLMLFREVLRGPSLLPFTGDTENREHVKVRKDEYSSLSAFVEYNSNLLTDIKEAHYEGMTCLGLSALAGIIVIVLFGYIQIGYHDAALFLLIPFSIGLAQSVWNFYSHRGIPPSDPPVLIQEDNEYLLLYNVERVVSAFLEFWAFLLILSICLTWATILFGGIV